jgi:predicted dehydrogenase
MALTVRLGPVVQRDWRAIVPLVANAFPPTAQVTGEAPPGARPIGIVLNGVTGRMGTNQHLVRSILAIREQGGVPAGAGEVLWPEPVLVGRDERKLRALAETHGLERWSTDLDDALADPSCEVYFDSQATSRREAAVRAAIAAGKHVYCEKPITEDLAAALELARLADAAGIKHGVVQDKLFLPGLRTLKRVLDSGTLGRVLSVRGEFGYWVFPGPDPAPQRPSWNYRAEDGGGIVSDMFAHWRYVLDELFAPVRGVFALGAIHLPVRHDERGEPYDATAEDGAYAIFELAGGVIAQLNSSWCVRVDRDELFELQVDGTEGSAVAGLRECRVQPAAATPRAVWNPDLADPVDHRAAWLHVPGGEHDNAFKVQWERFLRYVVLDEPFPWDFRAAARGVQLAELGLQSWRERRWVEVPEL